MSTALRVIGAILGAGLGIAVFLLVQSVPVYAIYRSWPWSWWWIGIIGGYISLWSIVPEATRNPRNHSLLAAGGAWLAVWLGCSIACIYQHSR